MFSVLPSDLPNTAALALATIILSALAFVLAVRPAWVNLKRKWLWYVIPIALFTSVLYGLEAKTNAGTPWLSNVRMWIYLVLGMALAAGIVMAFPLQFARSWLPVRFRGGDPRMGIAFCALVIASLLLLGAYAFGSKVMATVNDQYIPTYWESIQHAAYAWASNVLGVAVWVAAIWLIVKVVRRFSCWFTNTRLGNRVGYYAITFREWLATKARSLWQRATRRHSRP